MPDRATPGSSVHQALLSRGFSRQEYWSALPFPYPMYACMLNFFSRVRLYATLRTTTHQAPLSTGFSRQEYWSELPFLSPLINPRSNYYCYLSALEILCIFKYFKVSSVNWLIVNKFIRSLSLLRHQSGQRRWLHGCVLSDFSRVQSLEPYEL